MKNVRKIGLIGDVHGKVTTYMQRIHKFDATIQVGDFGFMTDWQKIARKKVNSEYHKIVPGNHEDYNFLLNEGSPYSLGHFGTEYFHGLNFFFVRGAYSIDEDMRIIGISWWQEEQITYIQQEKALTEYIDTKPDIVITHTLPYDVVDNIFPYMGSIRCSTTSLFQEMFSVHKPKLWVCGHFHPIKVLMKDILGTKFIILPELGTITYYPNKTIEENIKKYEDEYNK